MMRNILLKIYMSARQKENYPIIITGRAGSSNHYSQKRYMLVVKSAPVHFSCLLESLLLHKIKADTHRVCYPTTSCFVIRLPITLIIMCYCYHFMQIVYSQLLQTQCYIQELSNNSGLQSFVTFLVWYLRLTLDHDHAGHWADNVQSTQMCALATNVRKPDTPVLWKPEPQLITTHLLGRGASSGQMRTLGLFIVGRTAKGLSTVIETKEKRAFICYSSEINTSATNNLLDTYKCLYSPFC